MTELRVPQLNINGIKRKVAKFRHLAHDLTHNVIFISETKLERDEVPLSISSYDCK